MAQPVSSTLPLKASLDPQTYSTQVPIMPQKGPSSGYPYPERSQSDHEHAFKLSQTSKHKSKVVKRAKSTPHLNVSASTSPTAESPEDSTERKRINKLGYHRTTIACGLCFDRTSPGMVPLTHKHRALSQAEDKMSASACTRPIREMFQLRPIEEGVHVLSH